MIKRVLTIGFAFLYLGVLVTTVSAQRKGGFIIPPEAKDEKNPLTMSDAVLAGGKKLYEAKCQKCHGKTGKGDGPDADPKAVKDMDLINMDVAKNPDGVVFYKIWNGRETPKMPPLKDEATKEQVWAIVAYTQTLHKK